MGKVAKGSRKGKKAWRTNIRTDDIEEYFEKATKDAHSGVSSTITSLPSESLFYVDKSTDVPVKRKIEKHRNKVLRHESLLQRNPFVQPVPSSVLKKCKERKERKTVKTEIGDASKDPALQLDIWNSRGEENAKTKKKSTTFLIPAVEVEPPGCSFNPPFEAHQDSLAEAVADEMQKIYRDELGPQPVPLIVPGEIIHEEDKYFLDADDGNESNEDQDNVNDELLAQRWKGLCEIMTMALTITGIGVLQICGTTLILVDASRVAAMMLWNHIVAWDYNGSRDSTGVYLRLSLCIAFTGNELAVMF